MLSQELPDRITLMPTCSINIKPDGVTAKLAIQVLQHLEKSFSVAAFRLDNSCTAQERSYPAGNIQTFLMLTGRRDLQPFSNERPTTTKPWMKGKSTFVLKNNSFFRTQRFEFFLGSWRTSSRLLPLPGDTHDWPALIDTRADASSTGPDGLSALSQIAAANGSPTWGRPSGRDSGRTSGAIPPDDAPTGPQSSASSGPGDQTAFSGSGLLPRLYLPLASSGLRSFGSGLKPRISSPAFAPPVPAGGWQSLRRSKHRGFSRPEPTTVLLMLYRGSRGRYSCLQYSTRLIKL